jgi:hypothetical protein
MSPKVLCEKVSIAGTRARLVRLLHRGIDRGLVADVECESQVPLAAFQLQRIEQVDVAGCGGDAIAATLPWASSDTSFHLSQVPNRSAYSRLIIGRPASPKNTRSGGSAASTNQTL